MRMQRFDSQELRQLRNEIDIHVLIEQITGWPCKWRDGFLRFVCPLCSEFNTSVNPKTNLARCFRCEKNFNPIDWMMVTEGRGFVEAVTFLKELRC